MVADEGNQRRIALVIGNAAYTRMRPLRNTRADADEIACALADVGFTSHECNAIGVFSKLIPYHNQTQQGMNALLADFSIACQDADMAVIYYSGHGVEIGSRNFLIPIDAETRNVASVVYRTIPLPSVTDAVAGASRLRLVVLDACRDNPLAESLKGFDAGKSVGTGLGRPENSGSALVFYAATAGRVAREGIEGELSPFAQALGRRLRERDCELAYMFGRVTADVLHATNKSQEPTMYGPWIAERIFLSASLAPPLQDLDNQSDKMTPPLAVPKPDDLGHKAVPPGGPQLPKKPPQSYTRRLLLWSFAFIAIASAIIFAGRELIALNEERARKQKEAEAAVITAQNEARTKELADEKEADFKRQKDEAAVKAAARTKELADEKEADLKRQKEAAVKTAAVEAAALDAAKFDKSKLEILVKSAKTPKVLAEARLRLGQVMASENVLAKSSSQPLGYVVFAIIDQNNKMARFFNIVGKPGDRFPTRNDIITPNRTKVSLRAVPYHWDANNSKKFDPPKEGFANIESRQKAKVAGDCFIATEGNSQYAIAPISKVFNTNIQKTGPSFYPNTSGKILGYVYVGLIDEKTGMYKERKFKNEKKSDAIYPAPNDILVAMTDVHFRTGPSKWDADQKRPVNATTVKRQGWADQDQIIKQGQRVKVGGDTVLATGGLSVWAPISKILSTSE